jgi:septal ring factor EnvC (AmiA/AmiB activator)
MEDLLNEIASDMKSRMNVGGFGRRGPNPPGPNPQWRALIIANSVLLAAIVLIVLVFGGGQKESSKDLDQIKAKLEQLEERLTRLEGQSADLPQRRTKEVEPESRKSEEGRYHVVRTGDTLSGISQRYGMTIGELCRLNGIKRTTVIRVGQRLLVSEGGR